MNKDDLTTENGWEGWSKYVLKTLEKLEVKISSIEEAVNLNNLTIQKDLVELKTKAGIVAAISSIIVSAIVSLIVGVTVYNLTKRSDIDPPKPPVKSQYEYVINRG